MPIPSHNSGTVAPNLFSLSRHDTNRSTDLLLSAESSPSSQTDGQGIRRSSSCNFSSSASLHLGEQSSHNGHETLGSNASLSTLGLSSSEFNLPMMDLFRRTGSDQLRNSVDCLRAAPQPELLRRKSADFGPNTALGAGTRHRHVPENGSQLASLDHLRSQDQLDLTCLRQVKVGKEHVSPDTSIDVAPLERRSKTRQCLGPATAKLKDIGQYAYLATAVYGLPVALAASIPTIRPALFWLGSSAIFVTTTWLVAEAFASCKSWRDSRALHAQALPNGLPLDVAAIISAYLSNEIDVIEDTIKAVSSLSLPVDGRLKVVVAHNGGTDSEMVRLSEIIRTINTEPGVEIQNLHVSGSHSKAENVNAAISHLSAQREVPKVCVMYDADHQPNANAMVYALHSMAAKNAQLLQGRCVIKRGSPLLAAEFDMIYAVNHAGGSIVRNFAFFGGTNGYWDFDLLKNIKMDESMLTEDIDSSFRSLSSGAKVIYDPLVTSYEEAPDSLDSLMKQRLRWAQGWSQVSVRHLRLLAHSDFSVYRKAMIFLVLHWREMYYYLTPLTLPAAVASFITKSKFAYPLLAVSAVQTLVPASMTLLARYHVKADRHPDLNNWQYAKYLAVSPLYDAVKNAVCVLGHFRNVCNMTKWRVTSRAKAPVKVPSELDSPV